MQNDDDQRRAGATRREFLKTTAAVGAGITLGACRVAPALADGSAPAVVTADSARPQLRYGVMSGDVTADRAVIWSSADRSARMFVEYSTRSSYANAHTVRGPAALEDSDFTAKVDLTGLPPDQTIFYRVYFEDLANPGITSAPLTGSFRTPGGPTRDVVFAFSGDEAGQGWGINPEFGGYRLYETMRRFQPDFFIHSGDQIYADGPLRETVTLDDGRVWKNLVTEAKSHVAETLNDFRGAFAYNLLDDNKRRFAAEVPFLVQWDDHETRNNWYPGERIGAAETRYTERSLSLLAARANRAMLEYNPIRPNLLETDRVYRAFKRGPLLDVFMLDERTYRGPNSPNLQAELNDASAFLGRAQLEWLKTSLLESKATWKVIASDMPLSLVIPDGNPDVLPGSFEAWANGEHGAPLGRELEIAEILGFIQRKDIKNVVWVTADVHYAAAIRYQPSQARFTRFKPFWEFITGPINAGTFGPNGLDLTFGPEVVFQRVPDRPNRSPLDGLQFFGLGRIDARTKVLTMSLLDINGTTLYQVDLPPEPGSERSLLSR